MASKLVLTGNAYLEGKSKAWPATLIFSDTGSPNCRLDVPGKLKIMTTLESVSDRLGRTERVLELAASDCVFSCADNPAMDALTPVKRGWFSNVAIFEGGGRKLATLTLVTIALFAAIFVWGLPAAARFAAWATPTVVVQAMERSTLAAMERLALNPSTVPQARRDAVRIRFEALAAVADTPGTHDLKLGFRRAPRIGPNAFAMPGGQIMVTDGLAAMLTDDEIVGVLGHEIAHVTHRHSLRQLYRALGFAAVVTLVTGDVGGVMEEVVAGGGLMVAMAGSRSMELEADAVGVALLTRAGEDPSHLKTALEKLTDRLCPGGAKNCQETGWFSSHPGGAERTEALERALEKMLGPRS